MLSIEEKLESTISFTVSIKWNANKSQNWLSFKSPHADAFSIRKAFCWGWGSFFSEPGWSWPAGLKASCAIERWDAGGWTTYRPSASAGSRWHRSPGRSSLWHHFGKLNHGPTQRWPDSPSVDRKHHHSGSQTCPQQHRRVFFPVGGSYLDLFKRHCESEGFIIIWIQCLLFNGRLPFLPLPLVKR